LTIVEEGEYTVVVSNTCGEVQSFPKVVNQVDLEANAGIDTTITLGDTVRLTGEGGEIYEWSPVNSLSDYETSNPFAYPSETTLYTLTVRDSFGCINSDEVLITVVEPTEEEREFPDNENPEGEIVEAVKIPNAFSPNFNIGGFNGK